MALASGDYTSAQIQQMGLDPNETTSAQTLGGVAYKLDNNGRGGRVLRVVTLANGGQGSGGFVETAPTNTPAPSIFSSSVVTPPPLDLPSLYSKLTASSGIQAKQDQLANYDKQFADAQSKINDNPFLAEANRVGRIQKLQNDYNANTTNIRNEIAMAKGDVQTQLDLNTKQFDINNQQTQQALQNFNTLLSSGALDNLSGTDISQLTSSTGLSSSMIQAAVNAQKAKNVSTSTISFDDGTNQGFAIINTQTGEIINKQTVAPSKATTPIGGSGTGTAAEVKAKEKQQNTDSLITSIKNKVTLKSLVNYYSGVLSIDDIYRFYNQYSPYGQAKETLAQVKQGKFIT